MEENNTTNNKLSYEQLERIAIQMQHRAVQAEKRLESIDLATTRLNYLFWVLDRAQHFPESYIKEVTTEVMDLLEVKEPDTESQVIDFPEE